MDHLAIQQNRRTLERVIRNAIQGFEVETSSQVEKVYLSRIDGVKGITAVNINIKEEYNGT